MTLGVALEVQVVQRHDGSAVVAERKRVLEMGDRRDADRRSRRGSVHAMRSSCERAAQLDRLDAVGDELGMARDRGEPQVGGDARAAAQQVQDVRLLAGAAAAEDVGVDGDEREASRDAPSDRPARWPRRSTPT